MAVSLQFESPSAWYVYIKSLFSHRQILRIMGLTEYVVSTANISLTHLNKVLEYLLSFPLDSIPGPEEVEQLVV